MECQVRTGYVDLNRKEGLVLPGKWTDAEVREELGRILRSPFFIRSTRLSRFLRFSVECLLEGKTDSLKEYTVGTEVYDRRTSYDPAQDSIVRTEARRLRSRLREYYLSSEPGSRVTIELAAGSYVPLIRLDAPTAMEARRRQSIRLDTKGSGAFPAVAVAQFQSDSVDLQAQRMAREIEDEIRHLLYRQSGVRVYCALLAAPVNTAEQFRIWNELGVNYVLHGSARQRGGELTMDVQLTTLHGMLLLSERVHWDSACEQSPRLDTAIVSAVMGVLTPQAQPC